MEPTTLALDDEQRERLQVLFQLAALGQVASGVVHDARNAMTGVLGFVQVARKKLEAPDGARVGDLLAMVERESQRCLRMLEGLLGFAHRGEEEPQSVDVREVV